MKLLTSVLVILIYTDPLEMAAQKGLQKLEDKDVTLLIDKNHNTAALSFKTQDEVSDLLILVSNEKGETVFMDNKDHFKGEYKNTIDLNSFSKGEYSIKVKIDENELNKEFIIQ
ncbi:MAG: hypothetical protein K0Q95_2293 [Bacteroidota bacterium]|jgi:hypothetical protein|nr:hypothetical protein [Bacteroidota bacterium]